MQDVNKLKFNKTHEWIAPDGTVGISDHAQKEVTDVVFVDLPPTGKTLKKDDEAATIESVKAAFPIYTPASGKVSKVNEGVSKDPALVNKSAYGDGWLFKLELTNPSELNALMDEKQYEEFLKTEAAHH